MKYVTLAIVVALSLLVTDGAWARGRRGGCPGGNCSVNAPYQAPIQAPIQKGAAKGGSPSDLGLAADDQAAPVAPAVATTSQRTRRFVGFNRFSRRQR
jgi:hypothetical protein